MISKVKEYAFKNHELNGQTYDGAPYSKHLEMVVTEARKYIYYIDDVDRDNILAACYCHDLIEDTDITMKQLATFTNNQIANIVFAVSNETAASRFERNVKTFSNIGQNEHAIFVKLCDRIANTANSKKEAPDKFLKYKNDYELFKALLLKKGAIYWQMWQKLDLLYS